MKPVPAKNVVQNRIYERVAEPHKKLVGRLIARYLFQFL